MKFIAPERFWYLTALLLPAAGLVYAEWRRRRELKRLFAGPVPPEALRLSRTGRIARIALLFVAMAAAVLAAARPYWKTRRTTVPERGRDVAVVCDVSKSMWARDLAPSRLEHAKFLLRKLSEKLATDRLALIAFAGEAYTACPLTSDPAVFGEYVDELSPELVQRGGTDLEKALREALKSLPDTPGTRAIVLLTDGDELTGQSSRVIGELKKRRIPLIVIGLGDPDHPAELPDEEGRLRRDRQGNVITSRLNEAGLKRLAAETGGVYIQSTVGDPGIDAAAARIAELAPTQHGEREKEIPVERFDLFVAIALAALLLALLVPERPRRKLAALLLAGALLPWAAGAAEIPQTKTAAELYNLGLERHEAGDHAGAAECFEAVLRHPDRDERARAKALFNLGALEHDAARKLLNEARGTLQKQELDPALKKLGESKKRLDTAREFYRRALSGGGAAALDGTAADNLKLRETDAAEIEKLRKAIEEIKKQQQQAQQSADNARQQNERQQQKDQKQNQTRNDQQQQQNQKQNDQQQDQKRNDQQQGDQQKQDQQQGGQKQQPQSQGQSDAAREAAKQAAKESEKLKDQAQKLGQKDLEERAKRAADELRKAERAPDPQSAKPHLDKAVEELGGKAEQKPAEPQNAEPQDKPKPEKKDEGKQQAAPKPADRDAEREQLLDMLNEEEKARRRELQKRRVRRRAPVERDW